MTWRDWILAVGAGLSSALLPACLHLGSNGKAPEAVAQAGPDSASVEAANRSPYHPNPPALVPETIPPDKVEQAHYPEPAPVADKTPRVTLELANDGPAPVSRTKPAGEGLVKETVKQVGETRPAIEPRPDVEPRPLEEPRGLVETRPISLRKVESRPPKEAAILAAMGCFLDRQPAEAIERLKDCDKLSQEMLLGVLPLTARFGEGNLQQADPEELAVIMDQLTSVQDPLRNRAALVIDKMCFCRRIDTFGVYDPLTDDPLFQTGQWVLVYMELRNFSSEKQERIPGQPTFATRLVSCAEVRDHAGAKVWPAGSDRLVFRRQGPDESRSVWHDYFDNCSFRIPDLPSGRYTLWIEIEDVPTKRVIRRSLDFRVNAGASAHGS